MVAAGQSALVTEQLLTFQDLSAQGPAQSNSQLLQQQSRSLEEQEVWKGQSQGILAEEGCNIAQGQANVRTACKSYLM